jgi:hypothetical protein
MNNIEIWVQLTERHTEWSDPEAVAKLRARGLKALIDQAFECGKEVGAAKADAEYHRGFREGAATAKLGNAGRTDPMEQFKKMFGGKKFF